MKHFIKQGVEWVECINQELKCWLFCCVCHWKFLYSEKQPFQISLITNFRHPSCHFIHDSSTVLRVSGVPGVVTTFPPYLLKTWNFNKNFSSLGAFKVESLLQWTYCAQGFWCSKGSWTPQGSQAFWGPRWVPGFLGVLVSHGSQRFCRSRGSWNFNWFWKHINKIRSSQHLF